MRGTPVLVAAAAVFVVACYTGPNAEHFVAIVDGLDVPDSWQVAKTTVRGPDQPDDCNPGLSNECPAAIRYFLVEDDLQRAYEQAKDAVAATGFSITDENESGCDSGSSSGRPCGFFADHDADHLHARVFASPTEAGLDGMTSDGVVVVVRAYGSD